MMADVTLPSDNDPVVLEPHLLEFSLKEVSVELKGKQSPTSTQREGLSSHSDSAHTAPPVKIHQLKKQVIALPNTSFEDFQPFLMKTGDKQAAPDLIWGLRCANIASALNNSSTLVSAFSLLISLRVCR